MFSMVNYAMDAAVWIIPTVYSQHKDKTYY